MQVEAAVVRSRRRVGHRGAVLNRGTRIGVSKFVGDSGVLDAVGGGGGRLGDAVAGEEFFVDVGVGAGNDGHGGGGAGGAGGDGAGGG